MHPRGVGRNCGTNVVRAIVVDKCCDVTSFFMCNDKKYLLGHPLYRFMQRSEKWMDRYFVDPLLGLLLPGGWGDALSGLLALPAIYYSLWVVRSVPLTLAVTLNVLADVVLGLLPFMAGDVIDFFFRSYGRNMRLITGYVNGDKQGWRSSSCSCGWPGSSASGSGSGCSKPCSSAAGRYLATILPKGATASPMRR